MPTASESAGPSIVRRVRRGLQVVVGLALLVYGGALLTDRVTVTPPAVVYFVAAIGLLAYAIVRARQ